MKKALILSLFILIAVVIISCSRKTAAIKEPVIPQREASIIPATNNTPLVTATTVATDAATISLGKTIYETKCTRCHGFKSASGYNEQRWDGILRQMAPKARLSATETQQVAAYVKAHAKK
jgi:mono/diheme cytochrome c family protein